MQTLMVRAINRGQSVQLLRDSYAQPLTTVQVMVAHASGTSSNPQVELDSHADTYVVGDNYFIGYNCNRPVNVYSYDAKDGQRSAKTLHVRYQDLQSDQKFIYGLINHLLCSMQCCLNGVHISEVPKFLAEAPSETTHATELAHPFDAAQLLTILLQLSGVTSYFDIYSPSIAEYESDDIPKIHLTAEEPHFDP